jgi:hypothetical protein
MRQVGLDDLAVAAGTTTDTVEELVEDGVVAPGADGTFTGSDVRRVRLVLALRTSGVPFAAVGEAIRKGRLSLDFVDDLAPIRFRSYPRRTTSLSSASASIPRSHCSSAGFSDLRAPRRRAGSRGPGRDLRALPRRTGVGCP